MNVKITQDWNSSLVLRRMAYYMNGRRLKKKGGVFYFALFCFEKLDNNYYHIVHKELTCRTKGMSLIDK